MRPSSHPTARRRPERSISSPVAWALPPSIGGRPAGRPAASRNSTRWLQAIRPKVPSGKNPTLMTGSSMDGQFLGRIWPAGSEVHQRCRLRVTSHRSTSPFRVAVTRVWESGLKASDQTRSPRVSSRATSTMSNSPRQSTASLRSSTRSRRGVAALVNRARLPRASSRQPSG